MVNFLLPIAYKLVDSAVKKIPDDAELETGLPLTFQLFRQFVREKFTKHPNLLSGVNVASLPSWNALEMSDDARGLASDWGFSGMYRQIIDQIIQSAGIQVVYSEFFHADKLRILEIEPNSILHELKVGRYLQVTLDFLLLLQHMCQRQIRYQQK